MSRAGAWAALTIVGVLAAPAAAFAHGGIDKAGYSNYRTRVQSLTPAVAGISVRAVGVDGSVRISATAAHTVIVLGYDNEPYLRLDASGVAQNLNSPATYLNRRLNAQVDVPANATANARPDWRLISRSHAVTWHDHRTHWMGTIPPIDVQADPQVARVVIPHWSIPVLVDGRRASIDGDAWWLPPPSHNSWLLAALAVFVATVVVLQVVPSAWTVGLGCGLVGWCAATLVAVGRAMADHGTWAPMSCLAVPVAVGASLGLGWWRGRRHEPSWWWGASGVALMVGALAYLKFFWFSQAATGVTVEVMRLAVVGELGLGATLVTTVAVLMGEAAMSRATRRDTAAGLSR
jgi:hypothetical protein